MGWLAVGVCTLTGLLAGVVESFLIPLYVGTFVLPVAPVLAVATNVLLPLLGRQALERTLGAVLPFVGWLVAVVTLSTVLRPEGDVVYPGGAAWLQIVSYGVILLGGFVGVATIAVSGVRPVSS